MPNPRASESEIKLKGVLLVFSDQQRAEGLARETPSVVDHLLGRRFCLFGRQSCDSLEGFSLSVNRRPPSGLFELLNALSFDTGRARGPYGGFTLPAGYSQGLPRGLARSALRGLRGPAHFAYVVLSVFVCGTADLAPFRFKILGKVVFNTTVAQSEYVNAQGTIKSVNPALFFDPVTTHTLDLVVRELFPGK